MGEPNNSASRGRKRKGSSKSSTKSNKRKASSATEVIVKQEPITASPVSLPKNLELPTTEIPQYTSSNDDPQRPTRLLTLETPISKNQTNLTGVPNEIFVQICANLPPSDLLSLTFVCKRLNELLCSPNSQDTQAIWRTSRTRFLRFLQSPPPPGMDEKSYIVLKQLEKGCQICHEKSFVKVYWEFRVRCCESCLDKNTMSRDKLYIDHCIPSEVFRTLPHIFRYASHFYWKNDVSKAYNMFCNLSDEKKQNDWVDEGEKFVNMFMHETAINKQEEQNEQIARFEECLMAQSQNSNYTPQPPTPQQRIFIRQPQLTTAPMNFTSMSSVASMASVASVNSMANMVSTPTIPSMGSMETIGLTNPQPQFQQFNQSQLIIPQVQNVMNRSQFMITTPPAQQFYSHQPFVPRITRQIISPQQQMIPSHMMAGTQQMLTPTQMLTSQMVSPHCFAIPQFRRF